MEHRTLSISCVANEKKLAHLLWWSELIISYIDLLLGITCSIRILNRSIKLESWVDDTSPRDLGSIPQEEKE